MSTDGVENITALKHQQIIYYCHVAAFCLIAYELFIILDSEIKYVWKSRWNLMKVLYLITRYLPFVDTSLFMFSQFLPPPPTHTCFNIYRSRTWIILAGMCIAEVIFSLRTWALCERKRWMTISLPIFFVALWICDFYIVTHAVNTTHFDFQDRTLAKPLFRKIPGCLITGGDIPIPIAINWSLLLGYNFVTLFLLLTRVFQIFRKKGLTHMTKTIFMDGITYYVFIFIVTLANLLVAVRLPPDFFDIILAIGRDIHAILACRVILNVRDELDHRRVTQTIAVSTNSEHWK